MSTLSWQCGTCSGMFLLGVQIQGLITLNHDTFVPQHYQGSPSTVIDSYLPLADIEQGTFL